jgi:hypothetical protein
MKTLEKYFRDHWENEEMCRDEYNVRQAIPKLSLGR